MNISGNEIAAGKRRLEETLPRVAGPLADLKHAIDSDKNPGKNANLVTSIPSKSETQQILKRFEPLAPVLQKALVGIQNLRHEFHGIENSTKTPVQEREVRPPSSLMVDVIPETVAPNSNKTVSREPAGIKARVTVEETPPFESKTPPPPRFPQTRLESQTTGLRRAIPSLPIVVNHLPSRGQAGMELPQSNLRVSRPTISSIGEVSRTAILEPTRETFRSPVLSSARGELSPGAIRDKVFRDFQQRVRHQQPQVIVAEARQTIQNLGAHPMKEAGLHEPMAQVLGNNGIPGRGMAGPETVARIPLRGDNGTQRPNLNGRENTIQLPEHANQLRTTPLEGRHSAPPLSNINQLRRPFPLTVQPPLVRAPKVHLLDLVS